MPVGVQENTRTKKLTLSAVEERQSYPAMSHAVSQAAPAALVKDLQAIEPDHPSTSFTMDGYCVRSSSSGRAYCAKLGAPGTIKSSTTASDRDRAYHPGCSWHLSSRPSLDPNPSSIRVARASDGACGGEARPNSCPSLETVVKSLSCTFSCAFILGQYGFECTIFCGPTRTQGKLFGVRFHVTNFDTNLLTSYFLPRLGRNASQT